MTCEHPCFVSYKPVIDRPGTMVAVIVETAESAAAIRAVSRTIVLAALASLLALVVVSQLVARRVTAPHRRARALFPGRSARGTTAAPRRATTTSAGSDGAFNQMLDRLDESKVTKLRNEKLALAGLFARARRARHPQSARLDEDQRADARSRRSRAMPRTPRSSTRCCYDISQVESVIRDLIELARPGELRRVPADINAVIRAVIRQLDTRLTHRKVRTALMLARSPSAGHDRYGTIRAGADQRLRQRHRRDAQRAAR